MVHRSVFNLKMLVVGFGLLVLAAPPSSIAGMVSLDVTTGFGGMVRPGKWVPVSILVENRGRPLNGVLEVRVTSGSEYRQDVFQTTYARELDLPFGSRKRCGFTIPLHSVTNDLQIRFRQGGKSIVSTAVSLKDKAIQKDFVLVLDPGIWPDFLTSLPRWLFPVRVNARHLPATWYGYGGVRMIILNPAILRRLDQGQFQALEQWIKIGGCLITSAGINYGAFREERMRRLLPVKIGHHQRLVPKSAFKAFAGQEWTDANPLMVVNAKIKDAVTLAQEHGTPLVAQKALARGSIVFLSFDIQSSEFNRWQGKRYFWEKILALTKVKTAPAHGLPDQRILGAMLSSIPIQFPSFWPAAGLLILYTTGVALLLKRAVDRRDSRKKCTYYFLLAVSFFCVVCSLYYYGKSRMNGLIFNSFGVVNAAGRHLRGPGHFFLGAYPFNNTEYRFRFPGSAHPIAHLLSDRSDKKIPNPYQVIESPAGQMVKIGSRKWDYDFFRLETEAELSMTANARWLRGTISLRIDNRSSRTVRNALVFFKGRFYPAGAIAAGKAAIYTIDTHQAMTETKTASADIKTLVQGMAFNAGPFFYSSMTKNLMNDLLHKIHSTIPAKTDRLLLIGWVRSAIFEPVFDNGEVRKDGATLLKWEIPIEGKP